MAAAKKKSSKNRRQQLSAARIAEAALKLIDEQGLDGFSIRILARKLGCEAMSIYHYFRSKAHLYDAMVEICIRETPVPATQQPWLDRLRAFCQGVRATALRHPGFFLYFIIHRLNNRAGLTFLNQILKVIEETGLPPERRARHFRAIGYYLMGAGLDESMGYTTGPSAAEPVPDNIAARDFPAIMAVGPYFKKQYREATFNAGLETLLRNLAEDAAKVSANQFRGQLT